MQWSMVQTVLFKFCVQGLNKKVNIKQLIFIVSKKELVLGEEHSRHYCMFHSYEL